jgi:putative heme-binding domain-containing protein
MRRLRDGIALSFLVGIVAWSGWSSGALAQNQSRPVSRPVQPGQNKSPGLTNREAPAAESSYGTTSQMIPPFELADPQSKAEFLELVGANWIWSPAHKKDHVPVGDCYFRKTFPIGGQIEVGQVHIACDNQYELYVNGRLAGSGGDWRNMDVHDVAKLLRQGTNVVAVKATNTDSGPAGLVARVLIKERGGTLDSFSTDKSWRTSTKLFTNWTQPNVRDSDWMPAKVYGPLGGVLPWGDEVVIANEGSRFLIDPEFVVERMIRDEQAGSLIAMTFNSQGQILASQEGGPLLLISDADGDGRWETVTPYCDQLKNVQGILSLGSSVYAVGEGPDGLALYRSVDSDGDGRSDDLTALIPFKGPSSEHGPHAVRLGPEGLLYVLVGNFSGVGVRPENRSPYANIYEGDLVQPRVEDPNGYAIGIAAPGGIILRTDTRGSFVELVAGGMRNPYDFAFNADGELVTYDADMEWDIGAPWYRPTRINHVPPGAELGWRSGWAKWPEHYLDCLPATLDVGPGSPTGVECYDHVMFPEKYRQTLFVGDWALGQIHAIHLDRKGATYEAKHTTLLKGRPLNVTDLEVGPDGALYFCTGGRGTDGGIYRVRWTGQVPPKAADLGTGIQQALRQPQFHSDWARMRVANVKRELGERWQSELTQVLADNHAKQSDRLRAVDLLTFFGPPPSSELLVELAADADPEMRAKVARLMGVRTDRSLDAPLAKLLNDQDAWVRRVACESVAHRGTDPPIDALVGLLSDEDRFVAFAARRALEKFPADQWQNQVLDAARTRTFLQGATGLLVAHPNTNNARQILARCQAMLRGDVRDPGQQPGFISDDDFLDMLRVVQLALMQGNIPPTDVPELSQQIVREYPTSNPMMNRELVRLLAYLQPPEAAHAMAQQLVSDIPDTEKLQIAGYAPRLKTGWSTADKLIMLRYYERVRDQEGGYSMSDYVETFARDFFTNLSLAERKQVLAAGESFPTSALSVLANLPTNPGPQVLAEIRTLDQHLEGKPGEPIARLRVGITAVLGQSGEPESMAYLRAVYQQAPERRAPVAMSLAQHPGGENWDVLVDSLRTIDGPAAQEVLGALARVDRRPQTADPYRDVILQGLRSTSSSGEPAVRLLEHWTGQSRPSDGTPLANQLKAWQSWYAHAYPDELPAVLPHESTPNKWSYEELLTYLESAEGRSGDPGRGAAAFNQAQCVQCHRFQGVGEGLGPDLSTVSQRFQRKEILESIVYPSQVVSDQYASQIVVANGRTYSGMASRTGDGGMIILQSDGQQVRLAADDIEEVRPDKLSAMPEGLLNALTLEQAADLFAYLMNEQGSGIADRNSSDRR